MLFALFTTVAAVPAANAYSTLLTNGDNTPPLDWTMGPAMEGMGWTTWGALSIVDQPLATLTVGTSNVTIGGFGLYGRADFASTAAPVQVTWALFEDGVFNGAYSFQQTVTNSDARWFNSPGVEVTLTAGKTYQMGVLANDTFTWGFYFSGSNLTQNGLTHEAAMPSAVVTLAGGAGSGFLGDPVSYDWGSPYPDLQPALRVYGADYASLPPPIPEPSEWAMLLARLMVVAFVAKRRSRRSISI
jgi:hypothetical protein